jgi:16S rRNA (uracil1498-N3)-methyltransferase
VPETRLRPGFLFGAVSNLERVAMSAPRFHVDADLALGTVRLPERVAHHALRVLRLRDGAPLVLFNGRGGSYAGHLQLAAEPEAVLTTFDASDRESPLAVTVVQALVANEKLDWIVEKLTELGAARVMIVPTERSVVRLEGDRLARRLAHWQETVVSACAQCGRNRLPDVLASASLAALLPGLLEEPRRLLLPDAPAALDVGPAASCTIAVGPEGGFSDAEQQQLLAAGFVPSRLGPRVLRTETAGLAALAALQCRSGDLR